MQPYPFKIFFFKIHSFSLCRPQSSVLQLSSTSWLSTSKILSSYLKQGTSFSSFILASFIILSKKGVKDFYTRVAAFIKTFQNEIHRNIQTVF